MHSLPANIIITVDKSRNQCSDVCVVADNIEPHIRALDFPIYLYIRIRAFGRLRTYDFLSLARCLPAHATRIL